jgi:hypothetical protein
VRAFIRMLSLAMVPFASAVSISAQTAVDPSGHWEGTIQTPEMVMNVEIDLTKNSKGVLSGTFGQPGQAVKGLPLSSVDVAGRTVRFVLKANAQMSTFEGEVSDDGKTMAGNVTQAGGSVPFSLTRTGDARIAPPPKNIAIGKELAGIWNGTLDLKERQMRIVLTLTNHADGTATGTIMSPDGSGVEIPLAITHKGAAVAINVPSVGITFTGTLKPDASELAGTWTQGDVSLPLTFRRGPLPR